MSPPPSPEEEGILVRTEFVRHRNALVARADFAELYVDYYLHLGQHDLRYAPEHDRLFKGALAAFTLHCASRPRHELTAWTINFQKPLVNLFLTGDNDLGSVAGTLFTEHVKEASHNLFFAETVRQREPLRRSAVSFEGGDAFQAVEAFYAQSEQRPARYFQVGPEEFVLVSSHPDCDMGWFEALTSDAVRDLRENETLSPIETRRYSWKCGCTPSRMLQVLAPAMKSDPEELFAGEPSLRMQCPRCGARYTVTREALEAYVSSLS